MKKFHHYLKFLYFLASNLKKLIYYFELFLKIKKIMSFLKENHFKTGLGNLSFFRFFIVFLKINLTVNRFFFFAIVFFSEKGFEIWKFYRFFEKKLH